ncbi:conserved hypothetical protein [Ricinus communis]|uniref:Uncharacterized protein n=1 Tax=Ricinus communis TaxID=3988 RepID=B9RUU1_RICCO|nr:conserved hypothetical protein [Ricinus communis]
MHGFNIALLAKQALRLFQNPSSLLARVLKGKYYATSEFLTYERGSSSSWAWRSIYKGKELLNHGLRWKIGYGASV